MIIYQSLKHENRPNRFGEILCTKSVRKIYKNREKETMSSVGNGRP